MLISQALITFFKTGITLWQTGQTMMHLWHYDIVTYYIVIMFGGNYTKNDMLKTEPTQAVADSVSRPFTMNSAHGFCYTAKIL